MKRKFNKKHHSSLINIYALLTFSIKKKKKNICIVILITKEKLSRLMQISSKYLRKHLIQE